MQSHSMLRHGQTGAYLLEALIGILVFSLGVLGIVGLQAASLRTTSDSGLRAEAIFAANQLMGQMWADAQGTLVANYGSSPAGATYTSWASDLKAVQGGAWVQDPVVDFSGTTGCNASPSVVQGTATPSVYIQIFWKTADGQHSYVTCGLIAQNVL